MQNGGGGLNSDCGTPGGVGRTPAGGGGRLGECNGWCERTNPPTLSINVAAPRASPRLGTATTNTQRPHQPHGTSYGMRESQGGAGGCGASGKGGWPRWKKAPLSNG